MVDEIRPERFLPSSRSVAFSRAAWQCSDGYPEWLDYCEDLLFDFRLIECCGGFAWAPDARVHFRPRPTLRSFFKQYYRYARGDGKADLWRKRHALRYLTYLLALPALLALSILHHPLWLLLFLLARWPTAGGLVQRLAAQWQGCGWPGGCGPAADPLLRLIGDVAKMLGYPAACAGAAKRFRAEIHWRRVHRWPPLW